MTLDTDAAWRLILAARDVPRDTDRPEAAAPEAAALLDLYWPLAVADTFVLGHLGQSLDGRIACGTGHPDAINDDANIVHMHRLRALCDAVVVGAATMRADNPRLTTRRVSGASPARVIIAGRAPLDPALGVFTDGAAPTLVVRTTASAPPPPGVDAVTVEGGPDGLARPEAVTAALWARGYRRVFLEGGGRLVSAFLAAGALDRLQVCVAPLVLGSGVPSVTLPPVNHAEDALRPSGRWVPMGRDMLFDCVLPTGEHGPASAQRRSRTSAPGSEETRITAP